MARKKAERSIGPAGRLALSRNDQGSVMILTLWAVIFLALLASAIASNVAAHLKVASDLKWGVRSRDIGMRALADAIDFIKNDATSSYDTLHEGWSSNEARFKKVPYGEGYYSVIHEKNDFRADSAGKGYGLTDEEGKVNINRAPVSVLSLLFQAAGMVPARAEELARFIVDWRDENTTPEGGGAGGAEPCATLSAPLSCKNADFDALEELWWMPGMTAGLYNAVRGELTLYGAGPVNINTATSLALRSLGLTAVGAERLIAWRSVSGRFFENPSAIIAHAEETGLSDEDRARLGTAVASGFVGTGSNFYRGVVEADFGGAPRRVAHFVVNRFGELKEWRE